MDYGAAGKTKGSGLVTILFNNGIVDRRVISIFAVESVELLLHVWIMHCRGWILETMFEGEYCSVEVSMLEGQKIDFCPTEQFEPCQEAKVGVFFYKAQVYRQAQNANWHELGLQQACWGAKTKKKNSIGFCLPPNGILVLIRSKLSMKFQSFVEMVLEKAKNSSNG